MTATHDQSHEATTDVPAKSSVALQPESVEGSPTNSHRIIHRVAQHGIVLLLVSLALGLAVWLTPVVAWLFSPPEPQTDY
jgi:hypothetical protein